MTSRTLSRVIAILMKSKPDWAPTALAEVAEHDHSPFHVLISCIISLRTKDEVTRQASNRLYRLAESPEEMAGLSASKIEKAIYPAGFYRTKARIIKEISGTLLEKFGGNVPDEIDDLLTLKGVGRKTANLVVTVGFGKPGICVDTHVHRIMNRWGYVDTKTPDETESALRKKLPKRHWIEINDLLVSFGQNVCKPVSPHCSICPVGDYCPRTGVLKSR